MCIVHAGVDLMVDVHGDEELPYCFVSGMEGVPRWGPRLQAVQVRRIAWSKGLSGWEVMMGQRLGRG